MCVEEDISIFRIVRRKAARTSQTVMRLPTAWTRWLVPTPPIFWSSKHANTYGKSVGGQMASSSAKTMMSVVVFLMPWLICRRLLANGTVRTRMRSGLTWLARSCRGPSIFSSVIMRISLGLPASQLLAASLNSSPASIVGTIIVTSSEAMYVGFSGRGTGRYVKDAARRIRYHR